MAAESKLFDALSHPDLVKNCYPRRWNVAKIMDHICLLAWTALQSPAARWKLNTSGLNKDIQEMNPGPEILAEIQKRNIPMVIGADAHTPIRVAADFETGLDLLRDVGSLLRTCTFFWNANASQFRSPRRGPALQEAPFQK